MGMRGKKEFDVNNFDQTAGYYGTQVNSIIDNIITRLQIIISMYISTAVAVAKPPTYDAYS